MLCTELNALRQRLPWPSPRSFLYVALVSLLLLAQRPALAQTPSAASRQLQSQSATSQQQRGALITERSLYVDSTRSLSVEAASQQVFKPFSLLLNRSLEPTSWWIKIKVQAPVGQQSPLILGVGPYFLTELELYYEEGGRWVKQLSGAKHPVLQLNCSIGQHCFSLPAPGADQRIYFLRVNTSNGFYVSTRILASDRLVDEAVSKTLIFGIQVGILLMLISWSAIYFIRFRTLLVGLFCLTQVAALLLYCFSNGVILREFISVSPESYPKILTILLCLRLIFACGLCFALLHRWQVRLWFRYYCVLWISFWLVQISMAMFGQIKSYMLLLNWVFLFTVPFFLALGIFQTKTLAQRVKTYWISGALLVGVLMATDAVLLLFENDLSILTLVPGSGASMLVAIALYLLLLGYSKAQQEQWLQTMFELNTLKAQTDYEQRQLQERSTLIDMLSHELKNPLATMRMALGSLQSIFSRSEDQAESLERFTSMTQSIDNMTQVIDRVGQVDAIDQKNFVLRYEKCAVLEAIESLPLVATLPDRFKILGRREVNIHTDRLLFVTIINNLIDNAVKYSSSTSVIEVSVSTVTTDKLLFIVSNEVESHHAPDPAALFTRYYRSMYSHDKPGTGLGLVLVKSLCAILKGSVSYRYEYNRVFFSVELPL